MSGTSIQDYGHLGRALGTPQTQTPSPREADPAGGAGPSFGEALADALNTVDGNIQNVDGAVTDYVSGKGGDLHNVLIEMERADLEFRTVMQVRNKLLEAYQEIMRISV